MRRNRSNFKPRKQLTPEELRDALLGFLERKFYQGKKLAFLKDRKRLLDWVVLWPAKWLDERGVTLPVNRYREIFEGVFMDGLRFGDTGNITYLPAWLAKVIQSHFSHHEDEIYDEAKKLRSVVEGTVAAILERASGPAAVDPVRQLAQAAKLLKAGKRAPKAPSKDQLSLL